MQPRKPHNPARAGKPGNASTRSQRQLRVGELIRHALSDVLARGNLRDPILEKNVITISEVRASPDLRQATVFVVPLITTDGKPNDPKELLAALTKCKAHLRGQLARMLTLRATPDLSFEADLSFDEALKVDRLLNRTDVKRDLTER